MAGLGPDGARRPGQDAAGQARGAEGAGEAAARERVQPGQVLPVHTGDKLRDGAIHCGDRGERWIRRPVHVVNRSTVRLQFLARNSESLLVFSTISRWAQIFFTDNLETQIMGECALGADDVHKEC